MKLIVFRLVCALLLAGSIGQWIRAESSGDRAFFAVLAAALVLGIVLTEWERRRTGLPRRRRGTASS